MASPDSLALLVLSSAPVATYVLARCRQHLRAERARVDQAEDERLTGWVNELRAAGVAQSTDPGIGTVLRRYAEKSGTGRHHASRLRPATISIGA